MSKPTDSCVEPARGPILKEEIPQSTEFSEKEKVMTIARVGHEAPDFEASAYLDGGFTNIKLSDYRGHWVVVCFYPGDFTYV